MITYLVVALSLMWLFNGTQLLLNWLFLPIVAKEKRVKQDCPLVSVIVPARNEEAAINVALRSLAKQSYPNLEVILINDCSDDETLEIAKQVAKEYSVVNVIDGQPVLDGWLGKPHALKQGMELAKGEIILFTDADIIHDERSIEAGVAFLLERKLSLVSLAPRAVAGGVFEDLVIGALLCMASFLPIWPFNIQSLWFAGTAAGAYILVRRDNFEKAGGIEAIKRAFIDDFAIGHNVKLSGGRTLLARGEELLKLRPFSNAEELIKGTEKNLFAVVFNSLILSFFLVTLPIIFFYLLPYILWPYLFWSYWTTKALGAELIAVTAVITFMIMVRSATVLLHEGFRWWLVPLLPLGALITLLLHWRAAYRTCTRNATQWRGRDYTPGGPKG